MSVSYGVKIPQLFVSALQGDAYYTAGEALLRGLQTLIEPNAISVGLNAPPGSPSNGDSYILGGSPTGAWAGQANNLAYWSTDNPLAPSGEWEFYVPQNGWIVGSGGTAYIFNSGAWTALGGVTPTSAMSEIQLAPGSRAVSTVYQNTTGKPLLVQAVFSTTTNSGYIEAITDSNPSPSTVVGTCENFYTGGGGVTAPMIVMPGNYYKYVGQSVNVGSYGTFTPTLSIWREFPLLMGSVTSSFNLAGAGRVLGGIYQNTSSSLMIVTVNVTGYTFPGLISVVSDSSATPSTKIYARTQGNGIGNPDPMMAIFLVLPGDYYQVNSTGSGTLASWLEFTWSGVTATRHEYFGQPNRNRAWIATASALPFFTTGMPTTNTSGALRWVMSFWDVGQTGDKYFFSGEAIQEVCDVVSNWNASSPENQTSEVTVFGPVLPGWSYCFAYNTGSLQNSPTPAWWEWTITSP